jgi:DNA-binding beta-propeller fold protein YncE
MRGCLVGRCAALLVSCAGVFPGGISAGDKKSTGQDSPVRIETVRTIGREDFHESLRDRLSGGSDRQYPFRMAADSQGRILITEPFLSQIQVFDPRQGKRWKIHGDRSQRMVFPTYIAVDAEDNIYVSEPLLAEVHVFSPAGHFLRAIGGDHLYIPFGLAVDAANRKLYVADHYRSEIQVYTLEGQLLQVISGRGRGEGELWDPCDLVLHHGMIFVLDAGNARFQIFDMAGNSKAIWPFGNDRLPVAFALDAAEHLYYVDLESRGMRVSDADGNALAELDTQVRYGQPSRGGAALPSFMSVVENPDGSVLALRPAMKIDVVKVGPGATATTSEKPEAAATTDSVK